MTILVCTYPVLSLNGSCPSKPGRISTMKCGKTRLDRRSSSTENTMTRTIGYDERSKILKTIR